MLVHDLNPIQYDILVGDKMVGTKLDHLERSLVLIEDHPQRKAALSLFIDLANKVKSDRNHATQWPMGEENHQNWRLHRRSRLQNPGASTKTRTAQAA